MGKKTCGSRSFNSCRFVERYDVWVNHGEDISSPMTINKDTKEEDNSLDDIDGLLYDTFRNVVEEEENNEELLKEAIPDLNISESFNKTKAMISDLGLDYKKIHACPNDCMLYWKERENDNSCNICKASRWKEFPEVESESYEHAKYDHKVPAKIEVVTYYGAIGDIIELDYYSQFSFVLFKCDCFEVEEDKYGLTCVYFNNKSFQNDSFVLPSQVHKCFYVQDPLDSSKQYVMKTNPRDLYSMGDLSDSMVQESYQSDHFDGEVNWVREDIPGTIVDKPPPFMQETRYEDDSHFDNTVLDQ
ncbi:hypothetical protein KIW84_022381 [Lathyrus oleraceus]|uniref:DUF4216 domain-containing protein n=1 Tax=Pisum sativum TaxID=3888 RepID=A0A9D4YET7_PEA|nr:hypothetical protein KIW84_022381 [Pisum sativum]